MGQSNSHSVTRFFQKAKMTDELEDEFAEMYVEHVSSKCKINPIPVIEKQCHLLRFINIGTHRNPRDDDKICVLNDVIWYSPKSRYSYNEFLCNINFNFLILMLQINGYNDTSSDNVCIVDNYCIGLNCKIYNNAYDKLNAVKTTLNNFYAYNKPSIDDADRLKRNELLLKGNLEIGESLRLVAENEKLQKNLDMEKHKSSIDKLEQLLCRLVCDEKLIK